MGGAAFKDKTSRIQKDDIASTLEWLTEKTGFGPFEMLGSAGKVESSGDIDLNVSNMIDSKKLLDSLVSLLGFNNVKDRTNVNQIFTCVPIKGDPSNGFVQVDYMIGDLEWQRFSYWSAGPDSAYKGLFRTELLKACIAARSDWVCFDGPLMTARVGPTFFHDRGVVWRYRHLPKRKDGKGFTKTLTEISREEFKNIFGVDIVTSHETLTKPTDVAKFLYKSEDLTPFHSFETLLYKEKITHPSRLTLSMKLFEERLNNLKVEIPTGVMNEISSAVRGNR